MIDVLSPFIKRKGETKSIFYIFNALIDFVKQNE